MILPLHNYINSDKLLNLLSLVFSFGKMNNSIISYFLFFFHYFLFSTYTYYTSIVLHIEDTKVGLKQAYTLKNLSYLA